MIFEGVDWNVQWAVKKTEHEFIQNGLQSNVYSKFSEQNRIKLFKEVYRLIKLNNRSGVEATPKIKL